MRQKVNFSVTHPTLKLMIISISDFLYLYLCFYSGAKDSNFRVLICAYGL